MMSPYRFISCNNWITLVVDIDNRRGYAHVGAEGIKEISAIYSQFCYEHKNTLKNL